MVPGPLESAFGELFEQLVVLRSNTPERLERMRRLALTVVELLRPEVLIVGLQNRMVLRKNAPESDCALELRISYVRRDLPDAPFARLRHEVLLRSRDARQGCRQ